MRKVQIHATVFAVDSWGNPGVKFEAGGIYPVDQDTEREVVLGNGTHVEVDDPAPEPEAAPAPAEASAAPAEPAAAPAASTGKKSKG